jgi:hypothetical protein
MSKQKKNYKETKRSFSSPFKNYWQKINYYVLYIGLGVLLIGFLLLAQGPWDNPLSRSISPIILLVSYLIIIPLSIFVKVPQRLKKENDGSSKS